MMPSDVTLNASKSSDEPSVTFQIVQHGVCLFSIVFNRLLIRLINNHTPVHLRSYSVMLLFMCIYEIIAIFANFMLFTRIISLGTDGLVLVYYGPCSYLDFPPGFCFCIYSLLLNAFTYYNIQMTASFAYRYFVLRYQAPTRKTTVITNLVIAAPTTLCFIAFCCASIKDEIELAPLLSSYVPQYDLSGASHLGIIDPLRSPAIGTIVWVIVTSLPCLAINFYSGASIHRFLNSKALNLAAKTRRTHKEVLHALLSNLLISQLFLVCVVCFLLGQFEIVRHPALEYAVHFLGEVCLVLSPIATIYFVKPYRVRVLNLMGVRTMSSRETTVGTFNPSIVIHTDH